MRDYRLVEIVIRSKEEYFQVSRIIIAGGFLSWLLAAALANAGQTLKEKMTPPADSVERENVRIWVPIERPSSCRLVVNILDDSNSVVRHLIDFVAKPGIYNFYWNKRDDSGQLVEPGTYKYEIDDCGNKKSGNLTANFKKWERESRVKLYDDSSGFVLELLEDSANVKVEWYNMKNRMVVRLFLADNMKKGTYNYNWVDNHEGKNIVLIPQLRSAFYVQRVKIDDIIHADTVRWLEK